MRPLREECHLQTPFCGLSSTHHCLLCVLDWSPLQFVSGFLRLGFFGDPSILDQVFDLADSNAGDGRIGFNELFLWLNGHLGSSQRARVISLQDERGAQDRLRAHTWDGLEGIRALRSELLQFVHVHGLSPRDLFRAADRRCANGFLEKREFLIWLKRILGDVPLWEEHVRDVAVDVFTDLAGGGKSADVDEFKAFMDADSTEDIAVGVDSTSCKRSECEAVEPSKLARALRASTAQGARRRQAAGHAYQVYMTRSGGRPLGHAFSRTSNSPLPAYLSAPGLPSSSELSTTTPKQRLPTPSKRSPFYGMLECVHYSSCSTIGRFDQVPSVAGPGSSRLFTSPSRSTCQLTRSASISTSRDSPIHQTAVLATASQVSFTSSSCAASQLERAAWDRLRATSASEIAAVADAAASSMAKVEKLRAKRTAAVKRGARLRLQR